MSRAARSTRLTESSSEPPLAGWNLGALGPRIAIEPLPWDFDAIVVQHARDSSDLLDIGTGGGEWLASLPERPPRTVATESWPPNVPVAEARLGPLGITVRATPAAPDNVDQTAGAPGQTLPFPDGGFSLVTARHSSFVAADVARILRTGGTFLTQQVGGDYPDFYEALGLEPPVVARRWDLDLAGRQLNSAGLEVVECAAGEQVTVFADVDALAWYLQLIPWTVEGFSRVTHATELEHAAARIPLRVRLPAFWLRALKAG
jgi:SAM-dependent methyltransferase